MGQHNKAVGEPAQYWNVSSIADGMLGGVLPTAIYYIPISEDNVTGPGSRYWTYLNIPKPDTNPDQGGDSPSREPGVWVRYQQIECTGPNKEPPCKLHGWPMYWDDMAYAHYPGANTSDTDHETLITGPVNASKPAGFYKNLLALSSWWTEQIDNEGMMQLSLPSPNSTNGTYLKTQAIHSIVRSMITRQDTWHPRYGNTPGFGTDNMHGLPDVFISTATAALEMGAMAYGKGVIDNYFAFYVRDDGMLFHHGMEVPASSRCLTVLATYYSYSGDQDLLLKHFGKAKALATWLSYRRSLSLNYSQADPRYGIPSGDAESENYKNVMDHTKEPLHFLSSAAEMYRAFAEMGAIWQAVGKAAGRDDISAHGAGLLKLVPMLYTDLHASLNKTTAPSADVQAPACLPFVAEGAEGAGEIVGQQSAHAYIGYPQMMYSGALSHNQVANIYSCMSSGVGGGNRSLTLGVPGWSGHISLRAPFGLAFSLLQATTQAITTTPLDPQGCP